ncbi:MAG TPA: RDD family protein [Thermoanaerobaculia bacterium]|nr:RDD family protein [Thermoanaerobaculia bacterium]
MPRFDEIELIGEGPPPPRPEPAPATHLPPGRQPPRPAPLLRRILAFLTDLSLFVALALALSPILPQHATPLETIRGAWIPVGALLAFLVLLSFFYFVGSWSIWGRSIGGTIFETRIVAEGGSAITPAAASRRWAATLLSMLTAGAGFVPALLPGHRSLADRMSASVTIAG